MKTVFIKNCLLHDGLGSPERHADLLIKGSEIAAIEDAGQMEGTFDRVIDAAGRVVCPGFVDIHRHCDAKPLLDPNFGRTELAQGITTVLAGNCGISLTPASPVDSRARELYDFHEAVMGKLDLSLPRSYGDYLAALEKANLPVNFAAMIGTGSVKIAVKGFAATPYSEAELKKARDLVEEAIRLGAPGVSLGIMYLPECFSSIDEFVYILEPVGRYKRLLTAHIRGEGDSLVDSVKEVLEIAKRVGCALEISHFKSCGVHNWRREIHKAIALIDRARADGLDVSCDFYPYEGGSTSLTTMLPPDFVQGDISAALKRLGTRDGVEAFRGLSRKSYANWDNYAVTLGWERILISGVTLPKFRPMLGMRLSEAAKRFGYPDAEALAAALMHEENGKTAIINMSMCQEDIDCVARLPYSNIISDAIYADTDTPHPRMHGAFPKIIREYVGERGIYTLGEAIRRMTSAPAKRIGLKNRGVLKPGFAADLLLFDPKRFRDNADFSHCVRLASGLDLCMVNGEIVLENDRYIENVFHGSLLKAEI